LIAERWIKKSKGTRILGIKTKEISVLEYEWKFHDLSLFALHYIPTEEHMIKKLRKWASTRIEARVDCFTV